jgi:mono/diheme cytochrome c family protein
MYFSSCTSRRLEKEMAGTEGESPVLAEGRLVFKKKCQSCHPNGESGVGPELTNVRVPGFLIKARIRSRAFLLYTGRMPQFDKHEISKKELNSLVLYIKSLQRNERAGSKENKKDK